MNYTREGASKNWDCKDLQTCKWAMVTVLKENKLKYIEVGASIKAMLATASG